MMEATGSEGEAGVVATPPPTTTHATEAPSDTISIDTKYNATAPTMASSDEGSAPAPVTPLPDDPEGDNDDANKYKEKESAAATTVTVENTTKVHPNAPRQLPKRMNNYSVDSLRSGPLPSIEECLFGMPRDITEGGKDDDDDAINFVPLSLIRRVASQGIDDDDEQAGGSHRALTWRVLLGYLPADRRQWATVADQQRRSYHSFVEELFCLEERDINGRELRGHHSKRHRSRQQKQIQKQQDKDTNGKSKKERREERRRSSKKDQEEGGEDELSPTSRLPVKFMDDDNGIDTSGQSSTPTPSMDESDDGTAPALSDETSQAESPAGSEKADNDETKKFSSSDLLQDDPSRWNMSVREQKILERLTNHEAVNQLLVKRDCQEWNNFLENATLLDEIRKDVNRTHPHLYFYLEPQHQLGARRYGALERILFVWAKLNKGVRYVQGMNELVGTLYYVLANDFNDEWADHAEADTYILFNIIMSEMRDIFVADMDTADTGLVGRIENMQNLLQLHDPQVRAHLDEMGIDASFYAVRWLTTLLSREFLLPDTIRLWDSMFASTHKENFLRYVCVAMVLKIREDLLKADFSTSLQLLQKYPSSSMDDLLDASRALWIYESQITMACLKGGLTLHQALQAIPPPDKVIMAFGLPGGVALTNREQLEQAGTHAKEAVKNNVERARQGMQTLSTAGQGILGGARRFIQNRRGGSNEAAPEQVPRVPRRLPFRNFSFGNRSSSAPLPEDTPSTDTYDDKAERSTSAPVTEDTPGIEASDDKADDQDAAPPLSDAETV